MYVPSDSKGLKHWNFIKGLDEFSEDYLVFFFKVFFYFSLADLQLCEVLLL